MKLAVATDRIDLHCNSITDCQRKVASVKTSLQRVKRNLNYKVLRTNGISGQIDRTIDVLLDEAKAFETMGRALRDIKMAYVNMERSISRLDDLSNLNYIDDREFSANSILLDAEGTSGQLSELFDYIDVSNYIGAIGLLGALGSGGLINSLLFSLMNSNGTSAFSGANYISSDALNYMDWIQKAIGLGSEGYSAIQNIPHPYNMAKFDSKFGKSIGYLSLFGGGIELLGELGELYNTWNNPASNNYDRTASILETLSTGAGFGGKVYINSLLSDKGLRIVSNLGKVKNQILQVPQLQYSASPAIVKKAGNIAGWLIFADSMVNTISGGIRQYGVVSADGIIDMGDIGEIGVYGATGGLCSIVKGVTFGLIDIDAEKASDNLMADAEAFMRGDSWAANYIRNEDNNIVLRFGVSVGSGAYIIGENIVEGVANGAKAVGDWISTGWDYVTSIF